MQSGATRMRQRDDTLPSDRPRSEHEPRPTAPGPHFAHDFTRVPVQAKLKVNTPGDSYEQEADRVAHELSGKSSCACKGKCSSCSSKRVQRKSAAPSAESADVDPILNGPGHPLDSSTRSFMEPYFGHDFSRVRVHSDAHAAESAESLGARAYTVGHHLIFGPGEYRPRTDEGKRLLAHELTHVMQQSAAGPMIQRDDKDKPPRPIPKGPAEKSPKLTVKEADPKKKPCACLVFMHHDEKNARLAAEAMHASCAYNLAIVDPPGLREIDIMNVGLRDPNELFPRHIFRECVDDDKKCQDEMNKRKSSTKRGESLEFVQRQFFMAIKKCSNGFALPIVALHNNVITDTAEYRKAQKDLPTDLQAVDTELGKSGLSQKKRETLEEKKAKLEKKRDALAKIKGKTFVDTPPAPGTQLPPNTMLYSDLEEELKAFPEFIQPRSDKATDDKRKPTWKKKIETPKKGGLLSGGMTNIFKWCQAHDNSTCHVGDPEHPDNVVWVTKEADFKALEGTKANVVLQTRVTPGESETDLSSMFVGNLDEDWKDRVSREPAHPMPPTLLEALEEAAKIGERAIVKERQTIAKREAVRFVNVETGQSTKDAAERLEGYRTVKTILQPLGLHCCDAEEDKSVEKAMETGVKPKPPEPKKEEPKKEAPSGTSK